MLNYTKKPDRKKQQMATKSEKILI